MTEGSSPFLKQLASSDRSIRDKSLLALRSYLSHRPTFSELELLKLWKGLFFCMWMSDKPRTQQQLARDLASLVTDAARKDAVIGFLEAFWRTMAREWVGIDVLRMDKFLYLVRVYIRAAWTRFEKDGWKDMAMVEDYLRILEDIPLNPEDMKIPDGMRYHVIEVYIDELEECGLLKSEDDISQREELEKKRELVKKLLRPVERIGKETSNKVVREKVMEATEDERLTKFLGISSSNEEAEDIGEDEEWGGLDE